MGQFSGSRRRLISNLFSRCPSLSSISLRREGLCLVLSGQRKFRRSQLSATKKKKKKKKRSESAVTGLNSLLSLQALVVPRNPLWMEEAEVAGDHQSRIANDQAKGTACTHLHAVPAAQGSVCKWQGARQTHCEASSSRSSGFAFLTFAPVLSWVARVALRITTEQVGLQPPSQRLRGSGAGLGAALTFSPLSPLDWPWTSTF